MSRSSRLSRKPLILWSQSYVLWVLCLEQLQSLELSTSSSSTLRLDHCTTTALAFSRWSQQLTWSYPRQCFKSTENCKAGQDLVHCGSSPSSGFLHRQSISQMRPLWPAKHRLALTTHRLRKISLKLLQGVP